jgi:hypothetical protein
MTGEGFAAGEGIAAEEGLAAGLHFFVIARPKGVAIWL